MHAPSTTGCQARRRGTILVVVLVVLVMLTLAAYNYSQFMMTEMEAAAMQAADVQARVLADSGAEYVAVLLANRGQPGYENLHNNVSLFQGVGVSDSPNARARGRFTIIAPLEHDSESAAVRYGLIDESGKLNLNMIVKLGLEDDDARWLLLGLPGMTEEVADAILDFIDSDDTTRQYGAESEYYENLNPSYSAKNGPLETLDELLLVKGVTPELLYGEDANRNGLLDPNENDADASPPYDNADGYLQLGWHAFLTVNSREANLRADGTARIDVNNGLLTDLYDQLEEEFGEDAAKFVIGYRIAGPKDKPPEESETSGTGLIASSSSRQQLEQQQNQLLQGAASAIGEVLASGTGTVTRGGIDLSKGGQTQIKSLWELIGSRCDVTVNGVQTTLDSPWPADAGSLPSVLPTLVDALSTTSDEFIEGRININQARREVLIGLPNMTETLADAIVAGQQIDPEAYSARATTGWLFTDGLVDIWGMREFDRYLTARGDVYRAQILGFFDGGGPVSRLEVVVDATKSPPRITFHRDLNDLGRGYTRAQLLSPDLR
jgi:hypothetical protein